MTFIQAFEKIKPRLDNVPARDEADDFAVQVTLTNKDCHGVFYVKQTDGALAAEPYDYYDNDAALAISYLGFSKLIDGRLNPSDAAEKGVIEISGDASKINALCGIIEG